MDSKRIFRDLETTEAHNRALTGHSEMFQTNFKVIPFRDKRILQFAKMQPCQHCGRNDGTTVAAHQDGLEAGKGMGMKGADHRAAYLCYDCHCAYDQRRGDFATSPERELNFYRAMLRTIDIWIKELL
jgi:hypothetical protein